MLWQRAPSGSLVTKPAAPFVGSGRRRCVRCFGLVAVAALPTVARVPQFPPETAPGRVLRPLRSWCAVVCLYNGLLCPWALGTPCRRFWLRRARMTLRACPVAQFLDMPSVAVRAAVRRKLGRVAPVMQPAAPSSVAAGPPLASDGGRYGAGGADRTGMGHRFPVCVQNDARSDESGLRSQSPGKNRLSSSVSEIPVVLRAIPAAGAFFACVRRPDCP